MALGVVALLSAFGPPPAAANTVTVPDDYPTVQQGIDSGADEVLVRPGFYPESPRIARRLLLRALPGPDSTDIPETLGLTLDNAHMQATYSITVAFVHVRGPVRLEFNAYATGPYYVSFSDCVVDSGITDQSPGGDQFDVSILRCRIAGGVGLSKPEQIHLGNNVIQGSVGLSTTNGLYAIGNSIEGPGVAGIYASFMDQGPVITGNTIRGFDEGISLAGTQETYVRNNLIEDCQAGIVIYDDGGHRHSVTGNTVRSCGHAIHVNAAESVILTGNVAEDCGSGIYAAGGYAEVTGNRVSRCGTGLTVEPYFLSYQENAAVSRGNVVESCGSGLALWSYDNCIADRDTVIDSAGGILLRSENASAAVDSALVLSSHGAGITIEAPSATATRCVVGRSASDGFRLSSSNGVTLSYNTSFVNGGSGFVVDDLGAATGGVAQNISFGNQGHGLTADPGTAVTLSCNDWFGNTAGATEGVPPGPTDLAVDPDFCNPHVNDVHLVPGSPLVDAPGCGLIGALGAACSEGVTPTLVQRFTAGRVGDGIRVIWEVAPGATASEVWLERSEGSSGAAWTRPVTERSMDNRAVVEVDRSALRERAYWYRLVALEENSAAVIGQPIVVEGEARPGFRLVEVGPSPGSGPVRIGFALNHAAAIDVTVHDVQGRTVVRLAGGEWGTGRHSIEWNGEGMRGRVPPGLYMIRYRFPGGQDSRRVVISR